MSTERTNTIQRGGSRFYVDPISGAKHPGVTSVVGMLPKGFLGPWNAKMTAEFAADNIGPVTTLLMNGQRDAAVDMMKGAARRYTKERADIGTAAHDLFERLALGQAIRFTPPELRPYVSHFSEFLNRFQPEFHMTEATVWDDAVGYAGSFDAVATIEGERVVLDWKTSKDVHRETCLQLAAYRHAAEVLDPDGTRSPMLATTGGAVLHVTTEGWNLHPMACGEAEFDVFRHLRAIFAWDAAGRTAGIGKAL